MNNRTVWIESNALYSRKSSQPLKISRVEDIRVKEYDKTEKIKRSALIALVFSFAFLLVHPIVGLFAFLIIFGVVYLRTKKYELRVTQFNNSEIGSVESGFCLSNCRDEFDDVVATVKELQKT
ncbi:TPA: hypothetical protein I7678_22420 [Vibrio vulnificus]|uniref:hypothetical protein n=1 Tax=Vibrio vulnificus TaxID=672 RepID=UPI0010294126|nr:hypothetical protein [Vibrio vulnificus]RZQ38727.1 hypothetical protein D8T55_20685 [Vibrio vulnificus]HAS8151960.1 hypothetical protein [Vibrio vulnificus]